MSQISHRQLFSLAIPMILSNITVPLLGLVDTAVIGHLEHAYYLGGSTIGVMVVTLISWLCGFLRMSTTGLAAQAYGQQADQESLLVLTRGLLVAMVIGLAAILLQTPYLNISITLAGGSEEVALYARQYADIRIWALPAALMNMVLTGWLLGHHRAKAVMWLLIVTNVINLVLDVVFVWYLDWQVKGLAWATLIAEYSSCLLGLTLVIKHYKNDLKYRLQNLWQLTVNAIALKAYFKLNRDILIRTLALQCCFVFMTAQGARLGDNIVAANAILMNFLLFISFGLDGIANAAEVMAGKAKGAKRQLELQQVFKLSLIWTGLFALVYCLVFAALGEYLIRLISDIESVVNVADSYLPWLVVLPLIACWSYLYDGLYIGLTQGRAMRNTMLCATFLVFFPVWWIMQIFGNHGLWAAFTAFMGARGILLAIDYQHRHKTFI